MIIDIHVHPRLTATRPKGHTFKDTVRSAHRFGIDKVVLLGDVVAFGFHPTQGQVQKINSQTIALTKKYAGFACGFCFLNPTHSRKSLFEEMERCILTANLKGVKLEATVNARDRRNDFIMEKCAELGVPLLQHSWDTTIVNDRKRQSDPEDVAKLARRHPETTLIMAHLTAAGHRGILDIAPLANVYVDTSGSQPFSGIIEYAVEILGAERILFGSDVPGRDFSAALARIYGADISVKQKKLILGRNTQRLLGLD